MYDVLNVVVVERLVVVDVVLLVDAVVVVDRDVDREVKTVVVHSYLPPIKPNITQSLRCSSQERCSHQEPCSSRLTLCSHLSLEQLKPRLAVSWQ